MNAVNRERERERELNEHKDVFIDDANRNFDKTKETLRKTKKLNYRYCTVYTTVHLIVNTCTSYIPIM